MKKINVNAPVNSVRTTAARLLIALGLSGVMAVPAVAASVGKSATQGVQARNAQTLTGQVQSQRQPGQNAPELKVTYYTADPAKGGQVITTLTLTRPPRPQDRTGTQAPGSQDQADQPRPVNPIKAQAPAGAKFAVIQGGRGGGRVVDLSQVDQMGGPGMGGRGSRDGTGPRGSGSDQNNPNQNDQGQNDQNLPPSN